MGNSSSKNDDEIDRDVIRQTKKNNKNDFHRNVLMILTNNSHDMFKYFNTHQNENKCFITCSGKLFEKNTQIDYSNKNVDAEGEIEILYYIRDGGIHHTNTKEQNESALFIKIKIFIKQKCVHDTKNKQFIITGYDSCNGQYKMEHMKSKDWFGKSPPIYLNDDDHKKYDGTINVATRTNLTKIIGYEPTSKCIIDAVNYVLLNDFLGKNQNVADVIHSMLNKKNSQLHSFITNNVDYGKNDCDDIIANNVIATVVEIGEHC
jgi:hypothetical protein